MWYTKSKCYSCLSFKLLQIFLFLIFSREDFRIHFQAFDESALFSSAEGQTTTWVREALRRGRSDTKPGGGLGSEVKWWNFLKSSWRCFETHGSWMRAVPLPLNTKRKRSPSCRGNTALDYFENAQFLWNSLRLTLWRYFILMWLLGTLTTVSFFKGCISANISKKE